eukprot:Awhi_evm1s9598
MFRLSRISLATIAIAFTSTTTATIAVKTIRPGITNEAVVISGKLAKSLGLKFEPAIGPIVSALLSVNNKATGVFEAIVE